MRQLLLSCVDGIPRRVKTMSLTKREEFAQIAEDLGFYLNKLSKDEANRAHTYQSLYDHDEVFRNYCKTLLQLANVNPNWIDMDLLVNLLFPYVDEDGRSHKRGILFEFNFETTGKEEKTGESVTYEELLAMIWNSADSLLAAVDAAENVPLDIIINSLIAKAEQMQPREKRLRDKNKKKAQQDIEDFREGKLSLDIPIGDEVDL